MPHPPGGRGRERPDGARGAGSLPAVPERLAVVDVEGVHKTFRVPKQHVMTLKERALHPFRRVEVDELHALRDVSCQVLGGEFFGIVGRNGSGKSTLLKCLAGIYRADAGRIRIAGRLSPFIELGVGFHSDLTALDNVVLNGVMMGLTPSQARARFDEVIAFAELEEHVDLKLKNYSSGMQVRLAFAVMVQSDAEVLLIDEVLAVGDAAFQQKCFNVFHRLRDEGRTIVLVTHDMLAVERFCHRAMLLDAGRVVQVGAPAEVGRRYLELNFQRRRDEAAELTHAGASSGATVRAIWVEDDAGRRVESCAHGEFATIAVAVEAHQRLEDPEVHLSLENDDGLRVFATTSGQAGEAPGALEAGERMEMRVRARMSVQTGRYGLNASVHRGGAELVTYRGRGCELVVFGTEPHAGLVELEHTVQARREREPVRR